MCCCDTSRYLAILGLNVIVVVGVLTWQHWSYHKTVGEPFFPEEDSVDTPSTSSPAVGAENDPAEEGVLTLPRRRKRSRTQNIRKASEGANERRVLAAHRETLTEEEKKDLTPAQAELLAQDPWECRPWTFADLYQKLELDQDEKAKYKEEMKKSGSRFAEKRSRAICPMC